MTRFYTGTDWPWGLRCARCNDLFVEGQPISEQLNDPGGLCTDECAEECVKHAAIVTIVCVPCGMKEPVA